MGKHYHHGPLDTSGFSWRAFIGHMKYDLVVITGFNIKSEFADNRLYHELRHSYPDIVEGTLSGRQPADFTAQKLLR
jgi:hypothetical protein